MRHMERIVRTGRARGGGPGCKPGLGAWLRALLMVVGLGGAVAVLAACERLPDAPVRPATPAVQPQGYRIAPGDTLAVFVWQDRDLSLTVRVRPDGRISLPLVGEVEAAGKSPGALSRELEQRFAAWVQDPAVTVVVRESGGPVAADIRIVGEAAKPTTLVWRPGLTVLDAVIAAGGLSEFADGNRTILVRRQGREFVRYRVRLDDLLTAGDMSANVELAPGDVLVIPETAF